MRSTDTPLLAWLLDGSRMSREVHVRFCERPVVQSRRPTHPTLDQGDFAVEVGLLLSVKP